MSAEPCSPATVENRASISVVTPGWNSAALVYCETSSVVTKWPKAPPPLAWTLRSGTRSRLKCAIWATKWKSCSRIGPVPPGPVPSENWSLGAGAPVSVVETGADGPVGGAESSVVMVPLGSRGGAERGRRQDAAVDAQGAQVPQ